MFYLGDFLKFIMNKIFGWTPVHQIFFAILLAFFVYSYGQKELKLNYAVDKNYLFAEVLGDVPELKLLWDDLPIQNFYSTRIAVWNDGDDFIDSSRLISKDPLRIEIPQAVNLLAQKIDRKSRSNLELNSSVVELDGSSFIQIKLRDGEALESGDGFSIKLYFTSDSSPSFDMLGRIKGAPNGLIREDWDQSFRDENADVPIWILLMIICLSLLSELVKFFFGNKVGVADACYIASAMAGLILVVYFLVIPTYFGLDWMRL